MNPAALNMTCVVSIYYLQKNFDYACHHYFGSKFGFYISERYHSLAVMIGCFWKEDIFLSSNDSMKNMTTSSPIR